MFKSVKNKVKASLNLLINLQEVVIRQQVTIVNLNKRLSLIEQILLGQALGIATEHEGEKNHGQKRNN